MSKIINWFVNNTVAANLSMVIIIVSGIFTIPNLDLEVFPSIEPQVITVSVAYPGASPSDVEEAICIPIEENLQGLEGVKKISSNSSENSGTVTIELLPEVDRKEALADVKAQVDAIDNLPLDAERPVVKQGVVVGEVMSVAVSGNLDDESLLNITKEIRDEITSLPGITLTAIKGNKPREISIEVSESSLSKYSLSFDQVSNAIRSSSLDIPGGSVETSIGEILIRSKGQSYSKFDFEKIPILARPDGTILLLGDIAEVVDGFSDIDLEQKFNNEKALLITVFRVGKQNALDISSSVTSYISDKQKQLPNGISITPWNDESKLLRGRIDLMLKNAYFGLLLVVIVLALFLKPRLAFWVSLGIPISFMGGFWLLPLAGVSINMISLFVFILVLGIVVDDAIIVGENIFMWRERGLNSVEAAKKGASQVATPVIFAVLTTMATFSPMLSVAGEIGKIWKIIPSVTIAVLIWSLFESLTILPAHLAHIQDKPIKNKLLNRLGKRWELFQSYLIKGLDDFKNKIYLPVLKKALSKRITTISVAISIFFLTVGYIGGGWIKFTFFPALEADVVIGILEYPAGTPVSITSKGLNDLEKSAQKLKKQLDEEFPGEIIFLNDLATVGDQPFRLRTSQGPGSLNLSFFASHLAEYVLELSPGENRVISAAEVAKRWRELTGPIQGVKDLSFSSTFISAGDPINFQLTGTDIVDLQEATMIIKEEMASYNGVFDIKDSFSSGKDEMKLSLRDEAKNYGLNNVYLANQVRQAFYGEEVQNFQRGRDQVKVMLRYPKNERRSIGNLENMEIRTPQGQEIPLKQVAQMTMTKGFSSISRVDRQRSVNITADVDLSVTSSNEVISSLVTNEFPKILRDYPSVGYSLEGEQREQSENLASIGRNFIIALFVVYALLAIPFKSYFQPLVVMTAIPFGLTGALIGHIIMGIDFSMISLIGIVALSGVVVNDSLVLVDFINKYRKEGGNTAFKAAMLAGPRRFRPIILTSITTLVGLLPLLLEKSIQAKFLIPMAVSLAFGVLFATLITLILVPTSYLVLEDFLNLFKKSKKFNSKI